MTQPLIRKIFHKEEERIGIYLPYGHIKEPIVRALPGRQWSRSLQCWHIAYTKENIVLLKEKFPELIKKSGTSTLHQDAGASPETNNAGAKAWELPGKPPVIIPEPKQVGNPKPPLPYLRLSFKWRVDIYCVNQEER
jgi:hypothetical protein